MRAVVVATTSLLLLVLPGPAGAADRYVHACVQTSEWTFSPPLTTAISTGTGTFSWTAICAAGTASSPIPATSGRTGTVPFTYTGSCVLALATGSGVNTLLLGGVTAIQYAATTGADPVLAYVHALRPDSTCNEATASGVATGTLTNVPA